MKKETKALIKTCLCSFIILMTFVLPIIRTDTLFDYLLFFITEWLIFFLVRVASLIIIGFMRGMYEIFLEEENEK